MAARGWLAEAEIQNALHRACQANGLIKDDGVPAFQRTLESGLRDGLKIPHDDLKDREQYGSHEERAGNGKDDTKGDTKADGDSGGSRSSSAAPGAGRSRTPRSWTTGAASCQNSLVKPCQPSGNHG